MHDTEYYIDNFSFLEYNEIQKILKNGYTIEKENYGNDINILRKLSKVTGVSQTIFYTYAASLRAGITNEEEYFLNEKIDDKCKKIVIDFAKKKCSYKALIKYSYLPYDKIKVMAGFVEVGLSPELATSYKFKFNKKDLGYLEKILDNDIDEEQLKDFFEKGYRLSVINGYIEALNSGVDVLKYLEGNFDSDIDKTICDTIVELVKTDKDFNERNYKQYFKYNFNLWKQLHTLDCMNVDINKINSKMMNEYCLRQLIALKNKGVDITKYIDKVYNFKQLEEIGKGIEGGLNVSLYDSEEYECGQMQVIRRALKYNKDNENKIDVSLICNSKLRFKEMQHIVSILKKGSLEEKLEIIQKYNSGDSLNKERDWHEYR